MRAVRTIEVFYQRCSDHATVVKKWSALVFAKFHMELKGKILKLSLVVTLQAILTGYNQSVTGCGSQRRQCSCYSTKTHVNSMILILKLNLTSLRNIYMKSGLRWAAHTFYSICFTTKSNAISGLGSRYLYEFSLSNNYMYMSSLRTATCDALIVPSDKVIPHGNWEPIESWPWTAVIGPFIPQRDLG